jgi:hypothetical protein
VFPCMLERFFVVLQAGFIVLQSPYVASSSPPLVIQLLRGPPSNSCKMATTALLYIAPQLKVGNQCFQACLRGSSSFCRRASSSFSRHTSSVSRYLWPFKHFVYQLKMSCRRFLPNTPFTSAPTALLHIAPQPEVGIQCSQACLRGSSSFCKRASSSFSRRTSPVHRDLRSFKNFVYPLKMSCRRFLPHTPFTMRQRPSSTLLLNLKSVIRVFKHVREVLRRSAGGLHRPSVAIRRQ